MKPNDMIELAQALARAVPRLNAHGDLPGAAPAADQLKRKADRMGLLHAVIAQSKAEAETLRAELEAAGLKEIEGDLYRVAFADCKGATKVNWKAVAAK